MRRLATMVMLTAVALTATALPFLPGRYDALAVGLSAVARVVGMASVLLVPIGIVWLLYEQRHPGHAVHRARVGFVCADLAAASLVLLVGALAALASTGPTLAVAVLAVGGLVLRGRGSRLQVWTRRAGVLALQFRRHSRDGEPRFRRFAAHGCRVAAVSWLPRRTFR